MANTQRATRHYKASCARLG